MTPLRKSSPSATVRNIFNNLWYWQIWCGKVRFRHCQKRNTHKEREREIARDKGESLVLLVTLSGLLVLFFGPLYITHAQQKFEPCKVESPKVPFLLVYFWVSLHIYYACMTKVTPNILTRKVDLADFHPSLIDPESVISSIFYFACLFKDRPTSFLQIEQEDDVLIEVHV